MSLDQFEAGATRTLVMRIEKIDCDDGPRCYPVIAPERPNPVIDSSHDHVGPVGLSVECVSIDEIGHLTLGDVDLGFVVGDQVNAVLGGSAHSATNDSRLMRQSTERRRVCIHLAAVRPCSQSTDETIEPTVGEPSSGTRSFDRRQLRRACRRKFQNGPRGRRTPRSAYAVTHHPPDISSIDGPASPNTLPRQVTRREHLPNATRTDREFVGSVGDAQD